MNVHFVTTTITAASTTALCLKKVSQTFPNLEVISAYSMSLKPIFDPR